MICAQNLLSRNLKDGKYKIMKDEKVFCYLTVDSGLFMLTSHLDSHQALPRLPKTELQDALAVIVRDGEYNSFHRTAMSMHMIFDKKQQEEITSRIEDLILNHVIYEVE